MYNWFVDNAVSNERRIINTVIVSPEHPNNCSGILWIWPRRAAASAAAAEIFLWTLYRLQFFSDHLQIWYEGALWLEEEAYWFWWGWSYCCHGNHFCCKNSKDFFSRNNFTTVWWTALLIGSGMHMGGTMNWLDFGGERSKVTAPKLVWFGLFTMLTSERLIECWCNLGEVCRPIVSHQWTDNILEVKGHRSWSLIHA